MIGNFIADAVKGKQYNNYPDEIAKGILMHRFIDSYTDTHPVVLECVKIIRPHFSKYAPVALDVFFDYFLAKNWSNYHPQSLYDFTNEAYQLFYNHLEILPERNRHMLKYMSSQNWLLSYAEINGIQKALNGMAKRTKYGQVLDGGEKHLITFEKELAIGFKTFFEDLQKQTELNF